MCAMKKNILIALFNLFTLNWLFGQQGVIAGKVIDKRTGEALIGANVYVEGTSIGSSADVDGTYSFKIDPGTYTVVCSYTSYVSQIIKGLQIKDKETFNLDFVLDEDILELTSITVTAKEVKNTDASIITLQRKSYAVQDGISAMQISKSASSNAAESLKQITGASIEDGRYVVMRGLGDRYSLSQLNNVRLASTDPYRNSSNLDIIPSSMIDNIITVKSFTPDLPGNFAGGLVNVTTKSYPDQFTLGFNVNYGYNSLASFNPNFKTFKGGKYDWLGWDDGSRAIPDFLTTAEQRQPLTTSAYFNARDPKSSNDQIRNVFHRAAQSLSNDFTPGTMTPTGDLGVSFNIGNNFTVFKKLVGINFGTNYNRSYNYYDQGLVATWNNNTSSELFDYQKFDNDSYSGQNVQFSAIGSLALRLNNYNNIEGTVIFNTDTEIGARTQSGRYIGQLSNSGSIFNVNYSEFIQRQNQLFTIQGKHVVPKWNEIQIDWNYAFNNSLQSEPDTRYFAYGYTPPEAGEEEFFINDSEFDFPFHFFRNLKDRQQSFQLDLTIPLGISKENKLKLGGFGSITNRDFSEIIFQMSDRGIPSSLRVNNFQGDWNNFFNQNNFGIIDTNYSENGGLRNYSTGYFYTSQLNPRAFYTGNQNIFAGYAMTTYNILPTLKFVGGVRVESTDMEVVSQDTNIKPGIISQTDLLPSLNLIYDLTSISKIRFAASKTLARPNLRELAPFEQFDNKRSAFNVGNPDLKRTLIQNYDLRYEIYPKPGELLAASIYYKNFDQPIVRSFNTTATIPELKFVNVDHAMIYGVEFEFRKNLGFINNRLENFNFSTNVSLIKSEVDVPENELKNAQVIDPEYNITSRPFQGQSPYLLNFLLSYNDFERGWDASMSYNVFGDRLYLVGQFAAPDVYEKSVPALTAKISKRINNMFSVYLTGKNLLNPNIVKVQEYKGKIYINEQYSRGYQFNFGISYLVK